MITVLRKHEEKRKKEELQGYTFFGKFNNDIYVKKYIKMTERLKDGTIQIKQNEELTNLTRKINETAKTIKNNNAEEILSLIEKNI